MLFAPQLLSKHRIQHSLGINVLSFPQVTNINILMKHVYNHRWSEQMYTTRHNQEMHQCTLLKQLNFCLIAVIETQFLHKQLHSSTPLMAAKLGSGDAASLFSLWGSHRGSGDVQVTK